MNRRIADYALVLAAVTLVNFTVAAQQFPPLTITGTRLDCVVSFDAARQVFIYNYTIVAPSSNLAPVVGFHLDLIGKTARTQLDPTLHNNVVRRNDNQPATTVPVGIVVPDPGMWRGGVTRGGQLYLYSRKGLLNIAPGSSQGGIVIESHQPPASRTVRFNPSTKPWDVVYNSLPPDQEIENPPSAHDYEATGTTFGPADLTDADYYDGGGQQPAEVNKFLRFTAPLDNRVKLPVGTTSYTVVVRYGPTINAATFAATLNGTDITSQFHPAQGGGDVVTIPISGTTKLHLSVDGTKSSGGKGTDSDTLTFLPQ